MTKRLITVKELAVYIGTTPRSVYSYRNRGMIPKQWFVPVSKRSLRFDLEEVNKSIEESKCSEDGLSSIFKIRA